MRIGFVGLGAMGLPMASRLAAAGHETIGFDLREEARDALAAAGGKAAGHVGECAEGVEALVLMVVSGDQAEAVLFGTAALAEKLPADALVVTGCTQPAAQAKGIGERLAGKGLRFLDAPVSGGVVGAEAGSLTVMAGGPSETFEAAGPILSVFGDKLFHVGAEWGQGSLVKTINQLLCGVHIAAAAEAMALGLDAGIDGRTLLEIYTRSAAGSWMLGNRGPRMLEEKPPVTSAVDIFVKDLGIVLDTARSMKAPTPLAALAHQFFVSASGMGHGTEDDSQVIKAYRALYGEH